ncbi:hypothetical protein BCR41DRAFT_360038 [Lobosporangium transversale]|uniref:Uncharacterized protein n=1 Tax=Lobosporangium transversale TaxID=64571 RepID=A0A1Y2GDI7_9FUNG|nr:hypothetical protein BCR41DRAFT_360038 [Lobosporangium transversale]ORZ07788.1 hypothetical protein BCR41DRAFT_360038 [Lobosporangium transversale]|eukprot:XP_021878154.1 hypothetical protein BCR41DRAFT_360038 [Lobosporangium transversale]
MQMKMSESMSILILMLIMLELGWDVVDPCFFFTPFTPFPILPSFLPSFFFLFLFFLVYIHSPNARFLHSHSC